MLVLICDFISIEIRGRSGSWVVQIFDIFKNTRLVLINAWQSKSKILFAFFILSIHIIRIYTFLNLWWDNKLFSWSRRGDTSKSLSIVFNDIKTLFRGISNIFFQFFESSLLKFVSIFSKFFYWFIILYVVIFIVFTSNEFPLRICINTILLTFTNHKDLIRLLNIFLVLYILSIQILLLPFASNVVITFAIRIPEVQSWCQRSHSFILLIFFVEFRNLLERL